MAKFRFYQDKEVTSWVRDYFEVNAETLEDAIALVKDSGCSLDEMESKDANVAFLRRIGIGCTMFWQIAATKMFRDDTEYIVATLTIVTK